MVTSAILVERHGCQPCVSGFDPRRDRCFFGGVGVRISLCPPSQRLRLLMVRHTGFHPVNTGSIPVGVTAAPAPLSLPSGAGATLVYGISSRRVVHSRSAALIEAQGSTAAGYIA
jgi:hypothetical protein